MDIIAPMLNTSLTFIKILNMYINGKMRILMATIATKTPFFPNNITGKDAIHVIKIELTSNKLSCINLIHYNMPPFTLHFTIFISFCTQTVSGIIKLNHRLGEVLYLINAVFFNNTILPHAHTQFH